jgi:hypothetical protein
MNLPFSAEQFLAVFARYNEAIWPAQIVAYGFGLGAVILAMRPFRHSDQAISLILVAFWAWNGAAYHLTFFREINGAAILFGTLFLAQAALLLFVGGVGRQLVFRVSRDGASAAGSILILYAMVGYPLLGALLGHGYPQAPVFGVAPCPTTIFTFGLLLWTVPPTPKRVLVIPLIWSVIGFQAAISLGILEDIGLLLAGLISTSVLLWRDRRLGLSPTAHGRAALGGSA